MVLVVAVAALLVLVTASQPPPESHPPQTPPEQQQPRQHSSDASSLPSGVNQLAPDIAGGEKQKLDKTGHLKPPPVQPSKTSFDWITIFTGVLAVLAALQWWAMHRQAKYMRDGLTETKKAADAATSAADTATRALGVLERADVLIETIDLAGGDYDRKRHTKIHVDTICTVTLKNYGRSRAERLTAHCELLARFLDPPRNPIIARIANIILGAGEHTELPFQWFGSGFDQAAIDEINSGKSPLLVHAKITYDDVFETSHPVEGIGWYRPESGTFRLTHHEASEKEGNS